MNALSLLIKEFLVINNHNFVKMRERVSAAAALANNDIPPSIDPNGRMHAPFDGYSWDDREYHGGSYLPLTAEMWEFLEEMKGSPLCHSNKDWATSVKVKACLKTYDGLVESLKDLELQGLKLDAEVSHGKVWGDSNECYIYIKTKQKALINAISSYADEVKKAYYAELKKLKGTAPQGKQTITGTIISKKVVEGFRLLECKITVALENGSTVYGTCANSIISVEVGQKVEFSASFVHAKGDETHAYYKRPTKAKLI